MAFVDCNEVIQKVTTAALDTAFGDAVPPRTFEGGSYFLDIQGANGDRRLRSILALPIEDQERQSPASR
jgi:hypothetical protein